MREDQCRAALVSLLRADQRSSELRRTILRGWLSIVATGPVAPSRLKGNDTVERNGAGLAELGGMRRLRRAPVLLDIHAA